MKATFFSLAALAASAFAAPLLGSDSSSGSDPVGNVGDILSEVPVLEGLTGGSGLGDVIKRDGSITDLSSLTSTLTNLLSNVKGHTGSMNDTLDAVNSGEQSPESALPVIISQLTALHTTLATVTSALSNVGGLDVTGDVDVVITLVVSIVQEIVSTVDGLVSVLGLSTVLSSLLTTVFSLVSSLLALLTGLLGNVLPSLTSLLAPVLSLVGGPLSGVLSPLTGVLGGAL